MNIRLVQAVSRCFLDAFRYLWMALHLDAFVGSKYVFFFCFVLPFIRGEDLRTERICGVRTLLEIFTVESLLTLLVLKLVNLKL